MSLNYEFYSAKQVSIYPMIVTPLILALFASVYGATDADLSGFEGAMTNHKQTQDTLNRQLQAHNGHAAQAEINAFITGADSQIDNTIATVTDALSPLTLGLSKAVGNFLLGPVVQSVTNGAEVFLSNLIGGGVDLVDNQLVSMLTKSYSKLASLATKNNIDASRLESLSQQISHVASSKSKRSDTGIFSGLKGAFTNLRQTVDTLSQQLASHDGHAGKDVINAAITGLDSQIDNAISTCGSAFNGVTLGISGEMCDLLLGPFFQSITNGAEVVVSNVLGGSVDIVTDGTAKLFSNALSQLHELGAKLGVKNDTLESLAKAQKQVVNLKPPKKEKKDKKDKSKRATDADLSGFQGAMNNHRQVQDTLNSQLQSHNGHAAQAVINAYITGADSQIDNAIATVSDALAPFSLGLSKAIGNALLGPFAQSITNGAEVFISNVIGGGIDAVSDVSLEMYSKALKNLSQASEKYGVDDKVRNELSQTQQRIETLKAASKAHGKKQ